MNIKTSGSKWGTTPMSVASLVLGAAILTHPAGVSIALTRIIGWVLIVSGGATLASTLMHRKEELSQVELFVSLLELFVGILMVATPGIFISWIVLLMGVRVMMTGLTSFSASQAISELGLPGTGIKVVSLCMVVFGAIVVIAPFAVASIAVSLAGAALLCSGVMGIMTGVGMSKAKGTGETKK